MTPPFTLTSRLSRAKYANISLQLALQTDIFLLIPALISAIWISWFIIGAIVHPQELMGLPVSLVPLLIASCPLLYLLLKWYKYRSEYDQIYPQLKREIEFTFVEDGFVVKAPDGEAKIEWKEVSTVFIIGFGKR